MSDMPQDKNESEIEENDIAENTDLENDEEKIQNSDRSFEEIIANTLDDVKDTESEEISENDNEEEPSEEDEQGFTQDDEKNFTKEYEQDLAQEDEINKSEVYEEAEKLHDLADSVTLNRLKLVIAKTILKLQSKSKKELTTIFASAIGIILLFTLVLTDIIPILPNSYHRSYVGKTFILGETLNCSYKKIGDSVLCASNGSIFLFGPNMKLKNKTEGYSGVPVIRSSESNAVVYYKNSSDAVIITDETDYKKTDASDNIINANINNNGYYTIITTEAGYKACVSAYNNKHQLIYKWHTNNNAVDAAISPNGAYMAVCTVKADNDKFYSGITFFDLKKQDPIKKIENDNIVSELCYVENSKVIAFGDEATIAYNSFGNEKWNIDYSNKILKTYDICENDGTIGFVFNRYNSEMSESDVEIYNFNGGREGIYNSSDNVKSISANNGFFLCVLEKGTALVDDDGDLRRKKSFDAINYYSVLFNNYNFAFTVNDGVANIIAVKHR